MKIDYNALNDRARWEFFTQTIAQPVGGEEFQSIVGSDTLAAVAEGKIFVNTDYEAFLAGKGWSDRDITSVMYNVLIHENMHTSNHPALECPGRFINKLRDAKAIQKEFGFAISAIMRILNIVYDAKGDTMTNAWGIYDPSPIIKAVFQEKSNGEAPDSAIGQFLVAVREEACGKPLAWFDVSEEVREAAQKVVRISRQPLFAHENGVMYMSQGEKNLEITRIVVKLIKDEQNESESENGQREEGKEGGSNSSGKPKAGGKGKKSKARAKSGGLTEEEKKAIEEALEEAEEQGLIGEVQSAEEAEGDLEAALQDIDLKDPEESELARKLLGIAQEEWAFQKVWNDANKSVRFEGTSGKSAGPMRKVGNLPWSPGMPMRDLDIEDTVINSGRFIPGITTVRGVHKPGPGMPQPAPVPTTLQFSVDGSGSIEQPSPYREGCNHDLACAAVFALIRYAQKHKIPVGGNVFGNTNHRIKTSRDYQAVARETWSWICRVGGGNSVSGTETLTDVNAGSLLVYVTDFHLYAKDCERGKQDLQRLLDSGVDVAFIALFEGHNAAASGLKYSECKKLEDLKDLALKQVRRK